MATCRMSFDWVENVCIQRKLVKLLCCLSVASLTIGILFFDDRHYFPSHPIQSPNRSDSIENALMNIPTCTLNDRARQRALLVTLQVWSRLARQFHIRYWIAYGTLVGYVQRRGLLPHDLDVDILMMGQDTIELVRLATNISRENLSSFDSSTYRLVVHPQWFIVRWENRSYYPSQGIHFIAPNARFVNRQRHIHIDIWPMYDYHPEQPDRPAAGTDMLTEMDLNYKWKSNPTYWTFPLRPCDLSGIRVWCPAEPEQIVWTTYGEAALGKSDTLCINGSWV